MLTPWGESLYVDCEVRKCTGQCKVGDGLGERNPFLFFKEQNENKRGTNREQNVNVPAEQNVNKQGTKGEQTVNGTKREHAEQNKGR